MHDYKRARSTAHVASDQRGRVHMPMMASDRPAPLVRFARRPTRSSRRCAACAGPWRSRTEARGPCAATGLPALTLVLKRSVTGDGASLCSLDWSVCTAVMRSRLWHVLAAGWSLSAAGAQCLGDGLARTVLPAETAAPRRAGARETFFLRVAPRPVCSHGQPVSLYRTEVPYAKIGAPTDVVWARVRRTGGAVELMGVSDRLPRR